MKRKIAVILAADIAGYSRLIAEDEEETLRRFEGYRAVFSEFVARAGGRIFNTAGDAILAEFQSAVEAVRCAVDIQESLRARNLAYPPSRHMNFRIGITIGDVVERENGDLLGDGVNVAARLEGVAPPGGVCISRSVHEAVAGKMTIRFADAGPQTLKNIPDRVHAYTIALEDANPAASATTRSRRERLKLPPVAPIIQPIVHGARTRATTLAGLARAHMATTALLVLAAAMAGVYAYTYLPRHDMTEIEATELTPVVAEPHSELPPAQTAKAAQEPKPALVSPEAPKTADTPPPETVPEAPIETAKAATEPEIRTEPETSGPRPSASPLTTRYVLARQWTDCHESADTDTALSACKALLDTGGLDEGDRADAHYRYGRALRDKGEPDQAIASYDQSIALRPTADAYNHRGIAYFDKGDFNRAIADYTEAIRLDPSDAEAINNRAWTSYKAGNLASALQDANKAVSLDGTKAYVWDTRGHINEAKGNRAAAISDYRKALALDASSEESSEGLRRLGAAN